MAEDPKEKLAEERTDLAEDRTILANERTFAGWIRTGFAAVGIGLAFQVLFQAMQPELRPINLKVVTWTAVAATFSLIAAIWLLEMKPA